MRRRDEEDEDEDDDEEASPRRSWWRWILYPSLLGLGLLLGLGIPYVWVLDGKVREQFGQLQWQVPTTVYAQPLKLAPGLRMDAATLQLELGAAQYRNDGIGSTPGTFARNGSTFTISSRGFTDLAAPVPPAQVQVQLADGAVASLRASGGAALQSATLDPARIAALYGSTQEERELVHGADVPPLLVAGLQAVEDRKFKTHHGVDVLGIARAVWIDAREGGAKQGASTLTQQLVRNLFLSNERSIDRKLKEALYAIIIESRFDKQTILEAYLNQVYLGQMGNQSIHGVAAASRFWFARPLNELSKQDIALLIGLIKGPSLYDPRRFPDNALKRRAVVLDQFAETGLITADEAAALKQTPLDVAPKPGIVTNRYPAFIDLVRRQLQTDYPADSIKGAGMVILTTLDPAAQNDAETSLSETLERIQRKKGPDLEGGVVVTDVRDGAVLAVVGSRDATAIGFNRALDAQRPVGSLLKPFIYLLALAQPDKYSLATPIDDADVTVALGNGRTWSPDNDDHRSHGMVRLVDALAQSYNHVAVRVGMDVQVERLTKLMKALAGMDVQPNPSLLLGATDQTPWTMAQLYQFLASGGQVQPLHAVRGVLDAHGALVKRYDHPPTAAQAGDALAARLATMAMQQVTISGTAGALQRDGLGFLDAAGKTGTSNDSRDSWFSGFTGSHLAVIWVGNDQNKETGLFGATGALRVWAGLFKRLPSEPLQVSDDGLEWAWVSPVGWASVDQGCPGVRRFAFVKGFAPPASPTCDVAANPGDESGWIRVPSADPVDPVTGAPLPQGQGPAANDANGAPPAPDAPGNATPASAPPATTQPPAQSSSSDSGTP
ncbi:MAG: penicillin-binding protein 1B [Proteobacteria bacterium]|nr:penicillin-binding protein 1B [Pseudomonadota bacterium]